MSATPILAKQGALWVALLGDKVIFKSLEKKNVLDFIRHSWQGVSTYEG